jgi:Cu/Ag efflux pump CusA
MTTACAALGGVPMILFSGTGSEFRRPLGYAIVGGLIVSQALTLFTTPVVYIYLDKVRERFAKKTVDPDRTPRVEDHGQPVAEPT